MTPRSWIIGIAGGTASGKTTMASAATAKLNQHQQQATLLTHDRYYITVPPETDAASYNFDHPQALETSLLIEHVQRLKTGQSIQLPEYNFAEHKRRSTTETIHPTPIIFVEGILVLSEPKLRDVMDFQVFVDTPADIRLIRRVQRDMITRGRSLQSILDQYQRTVRPMHEAWVAPASTYADLHLSGLEPADQLLNEFLIWVHQKTGINV